VPPNLEFSNLSLTSRYWREEKQQFSVSIKDSYFFLDSSGKTPAVSAFAAALAALRGLGDGHK